MENSTRLRAGGGEAPPDTRAFGREYIQKAGYPTSKRKLSNRSASRVTYLQAFESVTELRKLAQNQRGGALKVKKMAFCQSNL